VRCRDRQALGVKERGVAAVPGLDPFSLAEPATVGRILAPARFADSEFRDVDVPLYYGQMSTPHSSSSADSQT
jgi:hypothetical protein